MIRPPDSRSSVTSERATATGCRSGRMNTHVPSLIVDVTAAIDATRALAESEEKTPQLGPLMERFARIDLGGGLGVPYRTDNEPPPDPEAYGKMVAAATREATVAGSSPAPAKTTLGPPA